MSSPYFAPPSPRTTFYAHSPQLTSRTEEKKDSAKRSGGTSSTLAVPHPLPPPLIAPILDLGSTHHPSSTASTEQVITISLGTRVTPPPSGQFLGHSTRSRTPSLSKTSSGSPIPRQSTPSGSPRHARINRNTLTSQDGPEINSESPLLKPNSVTALSPSSGHTTPSPKTSRTLGSGSPVDIESDEAGTVTKNYGSLHQDDARQGKSLDEEGLNKPKDGNGQKAVCLKQTGKGDGNAEGNEGEDNNPDGRRGSGSKGPTVCQKICRSLRTNLVPGILLNIVGVAIVALYYTVPAFEDGLNVLGDLKDEYGFLYSFVSTAIFGGIVPFVIMIIMDPVSRFNVRWISTRFFFFICFWGSQGIEVDAVYHLQVIMFGEGTDPQTIIVKVLFDQFVYSAFWAAWWSAMWTRWEQLDFSFPRLWNECLSQKAWWLDSALVATVSTWLVWIPGAAVIYSLPSTLQIPIFNIILTFWVLLLALLANTDADQVNEAENQPEAEMEGSGEGDNVNDLQGDGDRGNVEDEVVELVGSNEAEPKKQVIQDSKRHHNQVVRVHIDSNMLRTGTNVNDHVAIQVNNSNLSSSSSSPLSDNDRESISGGVTAKIFCADNAGSEPLRSSSTITTLTTASFPPIPSTTASPIPSSLQHHSDPSASFTECAQDGAELEVGDHIIELPPLPLPSHLSPTPGAHTP